LSVTAPRRGFALLRHRDFTRFMLARFAAAVAAQMIVIAVGWQVYALTGRVLDLGLLGLSQFLPFIVFALFAGHAADRFDRRRLLMACLVVYLAVALGLLVCTRSGARAPVPL
jgi:MFS family permease